MRSFARPNAMILTLGFLVAVFAPFIAADWRACLAYNRKPHENIAANDRFDRFMGFRQQLNRGYLSFNFNLLQLPRIRSVIRGRDGWLFYGDTESLASYRRTPLTEADLASIVTELDRRREWLNRRGIHYLVVIAPDKHSIYPEYMPPGLGRTSGPSRIDQIVAYARAHSALDIVDVRSALLSAKKRSPVYYKTDTHWTAAGAFSAYASIMDRVAEWYPSERAIGRPELVATHVTYAGDLTKMLTGTGDPEEDVLDFIPRSGWAWRADGTRQGISPVQDKAWIPDPVRPTVNGSAGVDRLVVFHDSFYKEHLSPFLSGHFGRTTSIWTHGFDYDLVMRERPNIVLQESVERLAEALAYNQTPNGVRIFPPTEAKR